jgi:hypothetical protein
MDNDDKWFKKIEVEREEEEERSMATTAEEALEAGRAYEKRLASASPSSACALFVLLFADLTPLANPSSQIGQQHAPAERRHAAPQGCEPPIPL